jgi:hypothetical protein
VADGGVKSRNIATLTQYRTRTKMAPSRGSMMRDQGFMQQVMGAERAASRESGLIGGASLPVDGTSQCAHDVLIEAHAFLLRSLHQLPVKAFGRSHQEFATVARSCEWLGNGLTVLKCDTYPAIYRVVDALDCFIWCVALTDAPWEFLYRRYVSNVSILIFISYEHDMVRQMKILFNGSHLATPPLSLLWPATHTLV